MTDLFLEVLFFAPTLYLLLSDRIIPEKLTLQEAVQIDILETLLPSLWAYIIFLYQWIILWEPLSLGMIIQIGVGAYSTHLRFDQRRDSWRQFIFSDKEIDQ